MASPKIKQVLLDFEERGKFGQDPTAPKPYVLMANENGITGSQQTKTDNVIGGDIDSGGELYGTFVDVGGTLKTPLYYEQIGVLLKAFMGAPVTEDLSAASTPKPGYYKHTFKSNVCIPSVVVQDFLSVQCNKTAADRDVYKKFNGLRANTLSITASPDSDYNIEVNFIGATADDSIVNASFQKLDDTNKIVLDATRIKNSHANLYINGSSTPYKLAKEFSMSLDRGTEAIRVLSAGAMVEDSKFDLTGSLNSLFDGDMYKKAMKQEKVETKLVFSNGDYSVEFLIAETQYSFEDEARSYGGQYPLNMKFNGVKTGSTDAKLSVVVINKVATY